MSRIRPLRFAALAAALATWLATAPAAGADGGRPAIDWPEYGRDPGGSRYAPLADITPENVDQLEVAWTYRTGDVSDGSEIPSTTAFEVTPILVDETLYLCTPFNRVVALDPETGAERWSFDPEVDRKAGRYANQLICRGVSSWLDLQPSPGEPCRRRILTATNDARLFALDAATGARCPDFGSNGEVDLNPGVGEQRWKGEYQVTSAPAVVGDLVVVGSAVSDNDRVHAPSGVVRAYDVRTGELSWAWDLAPPTPRPSMRRASDSGYALGTPNVWAPMAVDPERDLLFVPTGNPSPDYFRGEHPEMDYYGSAVVALRGTTGQVVWRFQTVHHDLWDYDVPAQPTLVDLPRDGQSVPALIQATKMGLVFVLNRETGEPLFEVEERPVPQDGVPGEQLSPTQPFPVKPPPLVSHRLAPEDAFGLTPFDRASCRRRIEALRNDGIFTPPSLQGSLVVPGNAGGSNWGGVAVDPRRGLLVANVIDLPWVVRLVPREQAESARGSLDEYAPQTGTPYVLLREALLSPLGLPCNPPPWGSLVAIDLASGDIRWRSTLGTTRDLAPVPIALSWGTPNLGGPLVTASGLVFIGAAMDDYLRAFDLENGEELWMARLPAGGQATPMTYRVRDGGRQFVVIAAGGHGRAGTRLGDHVVAFALPESEVP